MRARILAEAAEWKGTAYRHQASLKGVGADCVGLIKGVGSALGILVIDPAAWVRYARYSRTPNPNIMGQGMTQFLVAVEDGNQLPGDIAWIQWREDIPMHLAILAHDHAGRPTLIHSASDFGRVVEHGFSQDWRDRVHSWWRYPGVTE